MAEVYPSDAWLEDTFTGDAETGAVAVPEGTKPCFLEWQQYKYRAGLAMRRANDFRVFDEGTLDVGVKAGKAFLNGAVRTYAGSTGNTLTDDTTNYLYIDAAGALVVNIVGYPPDTEEHIRLARVLTAAGDISSITDDRGQCMYGAPGGAGRQAAGRMVVNGAGVVVNGAGVVVI